MEDFPEVLRIAVIIIAGIIGGSLAISAGMGVVFPFAAWGAMAVAYGITKLIDYIIERI